MSYKIGLKYMIHAKYAPQLDGKIYTLVHVFTKHEIQPPELVSRYYHIGLQDAKMKQFARPLPFDRCVFLVEGDLYDLESKTFIVCPDNNEAFTFTLQE